MGFKSTFTQPLSTIATKKRRDPQTVLGSTHGQDDTHTHGVRQGSINAFLTPPAASSSKRPSASTFNSDSGAEKAQRRGSPVKRETGVGKSKLAVRMDRDDHASASDLETRNSTGGEASKGAGKRTSVRPLQSHRSAPVTSSSSGMSDALDQDQDVAPMRRKKQRRRTLTSSPSPPLFDQEIQDDKQETPVASHMSSDRPMTPVPDYVLDIHRRLCGRDSDRMNRVKSPWRTTPKPSSPSKNQHTPVPAPKVKTRAEEHKRHEVDVRAHDQALVRRRKKQDIKAQENLGVQLVMGSSQVEAGEGTPKKRKRDTDVGAILSPRPTNTASKPKRAYLSPAKKFTSPLRRQDGPAAHGKTGRLVPDFNMDEDMTVSHGPLAVYQAFRAPPPRISTPRRLKRIPTGLSPRSAIPLTSPSPSPTPKHQKNTPPKNVTPTKSNRGSPLIMTSPDLGEFIIPRQPVFTESPSKIQDFQPVSMDAETLMTWSLGPQARPHQAASGSGQGSGPERPDPKPVQGHGTQKQDSAETQSQSVSSMSW